MFRSRILVLLVLAMLLMAGCSGQEESEPPSEPVPTQPVEEAKAPADEDESGAVEEAQPKEPVELFIYNTSADWDAEGYFMEEYGQHIQTALPHITPVYLPTTAGSLRTLAAANQQIDLIMSSVGRAFTILDSGYQMDLTPYIQKHDFDLARFEPSSIKMMEQMGDGKIFGIPFWNMPAPIYYNKDIFDLFGVDYPTDDMTWDELYERAQRLNRIENGQQYYGLAMSVNHYFLRNQLSVNMVDPANFIVSINNDPVKTMLNNLIRFYENVDTPFTSSLLSVGGQRDLFIRDRLAAMWLPVSTFHTEAELELLNWDLAKFPKLKEAPDADPQVYPVYLFISVTSEIPDEVFEVIEYLTSEEFHVMKSKTGNFVSLLNSEKVRQVFGQDAPMFEGKNVAALFSDRPADPSPQSRFYADAARAINTEVFAEVVLGQKDLNTALREAEEKLQNTINEKTR